MNCFYHRGVAAVAICKNCGRGLCVDCVAEIGTAIACKNKCETDVEVMNKVFKQSKKAFDNYSKAYSLSTLWLSLIGIGFIVSAFILTPKLMGFQISMGILMLIGAVFYYFLGKRYKSL